MDTLTQVVSKLPFWSALSSEEQQRLAGQSFIKQYPANSLIHNCDGACLGMMMVLEGQVRFSIISEEGREITLFNLKAGDCCVLSAACVLSCIQLDNQISAVKATRLLVVRAAAFKKLINENVNVRALTYELATKRFAAALFVMQQIIFARFDQRLAGYLLAQTAQSGSPEINKTQEQIAREVNSAREVVARMLRQFVMDGLVEVKRGRVIIKNMAALKNLE